MWPFADVDLERFDNAMRMFRLAMTVIGLGVVAIGLAMFFYKPKEEAKRSSFAARFTALVLFGLIGIGVAVYAWVWFGR